MEDYEKKYNDALERAKELSARQSDKTTMEYIFPELQENEDRFEKPNGRLDDKPNGGIVLEDYSEGDGFYKVNLAYLSKEQVEEIENIVKKWNPELESENERIKACIGMCLTDVCEQRFKDYNTSLIDCLAWLEKQGKYHIACSEAQMKVLDKILNYAANHEDPYWNDYILGTLNSIIKQLKRPKV